MRSFLIISALLGFVDAQSNTVSTITASAGPFVESVVPGHNGYIASEVDPFGAGVARIVKYTMNGDLDETFPTISVEGNTGLAITADEMKLYVAGQGEVKEFDLTSGNEAQTFATPGYEGNLNGLCLSHDENWLYATEPGWTAPPPSMQIEQKTTSAKLFAIDLNSGDVTSLLPDMTSDHSPNGCVVHPTIPSVVYMANFWHGVTAWDRANSQNYAVPFGANIRAHQRMDGAHRWGDGIVIHDGMLYMSTFGSGGMAWDGKVWSCDMATEADCTVAAEAVGADMQLDTRDANQAYLLLPQFAALATMGSGPGSIARMAIGTSASDDDSDNDNDDDDNNPSSTSGVSAFSSGISCMVLAVVVMQQFS